MNYFSAFCVARFPSETSRFVRHGSHSFATSTSPVFRLGQRIGSGGQAEVYDCTSMSSSSHLISRRPLVAKLWLNNDTFAKQSFHRESCILSNLMSNENSVGILPSVVHIDSAKRMIVMEKMKSDIQQMIDADPSVDADKILQIAIAAIRDLKILHGLGYIHNDIKPGNILCNGLDDVRLVDFGSASDWMDGLVMSCSKASQDCGSCRHRMNDSGRQLGGTCHFASLNSHRGEPNGACCDLESLIYTIAFCLEGSLPWLDVGETETRADRWREVYKRKLTCGRKDLFPRINDQMGSYLFQFLLHVRGQSNHAVPHYEKLEGLLMKCRESLA